MENTEKLITDLNDLVKGCVAQSKQANETLKAVVDGYDARLKAVEQYRKDLDALAEDLRKFSKQVISRVFEGPNRRSYKGNFDSPQQAKTFGLAVLGLCCGRKEALESLKKEIDGSGVEFKALGEGTDSGGGFLVPGEFEATIIRLIEIYGIFRANVLVVPMSRDRMNTPKRTAGLTVYCPGEGAAITASDLAIGQVALTAKKWCTLTAISSELEEDAAIAVAELVAEEIALAFAIKEDSCGFIGDGSATYFGITGILKHASTVDYTPAGSAGNSTFAKCTAWNFLAGIVGSVHTWALVRAAYYFHRSVFWNNIVGQVDANGKPIVMFVANAPNALVPLQMGGSTPLLLGYPVNLVDCLPSTTAVSTAFGAFGSLWRSWRLGQRRGIEIARSTEAYFAQDIVAIRGAQRIDIVAGEASGMAKFGTAAT